MPRKPDQPDPKPWQLLSGNVIGYDVTKQTRFGEIDRRANDNTLLVAKILFTGPDAAKFASFIVDACNHVAEKENRYPKKSK